MRVAGMGAFPCTIRVGVQLGRAAIVFVVSSRPFSQSVIVTEVAWWHHQGRARQVLAGGKSIKDIRRYRSCGK